MIEIRNIHKTYQMGEVQIKALDGVSLKIMPCEFIAIMGHSGSGKSTLMHVLGLLDRPDSGEYFLGNTEITKLTDEELSVLRNKITGFIFQQFHLLPRMTALENAELPLIYAGKRHLKERAEFEIEEVGLKERMFHRPNELSGGQQQRVAIARALVNEPLIILADEPTGNLDSKSREEIISILKQLDRKGKTIVVVTHEEDIAMQAHRIIQMSDGKIISDEYQKGESRPAQDLCPTQGFIQEIVSQPHRVTGQTKFLDYLRQAIFAMFSHRMRSFLSMLGVLIGVAAVIAMLSVGQGAKSSIEKQLASLGSNLLSIRPGSARVGGIALEAGIVTRFTFADVEAISKLTDYIGRIYPSVTGRGQLVYADKNWNTQVEGTGVEYPNMRAAVPFVGRFFTEHEVRLRDKVAVIGLTVARELFGDSNPVGSTIKINLINFKVIGVLPEKGGAGWRDQDDIVIVSITTAMYRVFGKEYIDSIYAEVKSPSLIEPTQEEIKKIIIKQHRLNKEQEDTFQIRNMADIRQTLESTTKTMSALLGSIAAISLLVGGIGIMNIMLVSVTERTREIGLRKAIGATNKDIMSQFLIEAVVMTFGGGLLGILLGGGVAFIISRTLGWAVQVSLFNIALATTFSIAVGMGFGLWPAKQASKLDPIEALRYE